MPITKTIGDLPEKQGADISNTDNFWVKRPGGYDYRIDYNNLKLAVTPAFTPPDPIIWPDDSLKTENLAISTLKQLDAWRYVHSRLGALTKIDDLGAMGPNKTTPTAVRYQREAVWVNRYGLSIADIAYCNKAASAFAWGFDFQNVGGWFENGLGVAPVPAIESDVFFMNGFLQTLRIVNQEPSLAGLAATYNSLVTGGQVNSSLSWMNANTAQIEDDGEDTPNRIMFAVATFDLGRRVTGNTAYQATANNLFSFATQASRYSSADGYFIEKLGWDTSYQAVSIMNLATVFFNTLDSGAKTTVKSLIGSTAAWLSARISTGAPYKGYISDVKNTRTNNVTSRSPEAKLINYPEAALAMFYAGFIMNNLTYIQQGVDIVQYAVRAGSGSNPLTNVTEYATGTSGWSWNSTEKFWAGSATENAVLTLGSWKTRYRPVSMSLVLRAPVAVAAGAWTIQLQNNENTVVASFTNPSALAAGESVTIRQNISWPAEGVLETTVDLNRLYTDSSLNNSNIPEITQIHTYMN